MPRSAPVPPPPPRWRAALRGALLGSGAALAVYLAWGLWQDDTRERRRPLARAPAGALQPAPVTSRADDTSHSVQTAEVEELLGGAAGVADTTEREPEALEEPALELEPPDAAVPAPALEAPPAVVSAAPAPRATSLPPGHVPVPSAGENFEEPAPSKTDPEAPAGGERPPIERHVQLVTFSRWQHPGLCPTDTEASRARQLMMRRFRALVWDDPARLYLDPRLARGAHEALIEQLTTAEAEIDTQLGLIPPRPNVFAYYDSRLLLAGSCANADVVAYYDGAVHVVPAHEDVAQSVVHEYTHHALASAGVSGPAWAHEGIAMHVARETWWRQREWLERVAAQPFSLEDMESAVPYTLVSEQAVAFYVQAAAMVACAIHEDPGGLKALVQQLADGSRGGELEYRLPPLADPRGFHACTRELLG